MIEAVLALIAFALGWSARGWTRPSTRYQRRIISIMIGRPMPLEHIVREIQGNLFWGSRGYLRVAEAVAELVISGVVVVENDGNGHAVFRLVENGEVFLKRLK